MAGSCMAMFFFGLTADAKKIEKLKNKISESNNCIQPSLLDVSLPLFHLDRSSFVDKGFIVWLKGVFSLRD